MAVWQGNICLWQGILAAGQRGWFFSQARQMRCLSFFSLINMSKDAFPLLGGRHEYFIGVPDKAGSLIVLHKKCTTI